MALEHPDIPTAYSWPIGSHRGLLMAVLVAASLSVPVTASSAATPDPQKCLKLAHAEPTLAPAGISDCREASSDIAMISAAIHSLQKDGKHAELVMQWVQYKDVLPDADMVLNNAARELLAGGRLCDVRTLLVYGDQIVGVVPGAVLRAASIVRESDPSELKKYQSLVGVAANAVLQHAATVPLRNGSWDDESSSRKIVPSDVLSTVNLLLVQPGSTASPPKDSFGMRDRENMIHTAVLSAALEDPVSAVRHCDDTMRGILLSSTNLAAVKIAEISRLGIPPYESELLALLTDPLVAGTLTVEQALSIIRNPERLDAYVRRLSAQQDLSVGRYSIDQYLSQREQAVAQRDRSAE